MPGQTQPDLYYDYYQTNWGRGLVGSMNNSVCRIFLPWASEDELLRRMREELEAMCVIAGSGETSAVATQLTRYFQGEAVVFSVPSAIDMLTPFQKRVAQAACSIPYGETRTYKWLAQQADSPLAFRAAGQVMARNTLPIVVPCHRVLGHSGNLGGFSCGLEWKVRLLELERIAVLGQSTDLRERRFLPF